MPFMLNVAILYSLYFLMYTVHPNPANLAARSMNTYKYEWYEPAYRDSPGGIEEGNSHHGTQSLAMATGHAHCACNI